MLVRQDNVIWAVLCFVLALHQLLDLNQPDELSDKALVALDAVTKHLWAFPVLFVGFGVFLFSMVVLPLVILSLIKLSEFI